MDDTKKQVFLERIFEVLIREEKRGGKFFSDAAKFVSDPKIKALFERLAADEERHVHELETIRTSFRNAATSRERKMSYAGGTVSLIDLSDMVTGYGKLPHFELFKADEFQKLLQAATTDEILKFAMQIEFDNAKYLQQCMEATPLNNQKKILRDLILEEKGHFIALKKLCEKCQEFAQK